MSANFDPSLIAEQFRSRYGEIGAPWESVVMAIAEAVPEHREAQLREVLEPFADAFDDWGDEDSSGDHGSVWEHPIGMCITVGAFRSAAMTRKAQGTPEGTDNG